MFNLHKLGWSNFQQFCLTVIREILGQTVESYLDNNDGGRDGGFRGVWKSNENEDLEGNFVIQVKFTKFENQNITVSKLKDEIAKIKKLVEKGFCDSYILMTNAGISGRQRALIELEFRKSGAKHTRILGSDWINDQIHKNKKLRMLVPRVYGLGDLSNILDERAYSQASALLESLQYDLAKTVVTDAYQKAAQTLMEHNFVLLVGEPAAGKTTIASMLSVSAVDNWGSSILKLDFPRQIIDHWNPNEPTQLFWLDDAFGVSQYEQSLAREWNHIFSQIKAMLLKGAKIIMTSRDYIYNRAREDLKETSFPMLKEHQVVIDVHQLSLDEKKQILYNHLKLGRQERQFKTKIKPFLDSVTENNRFIPEIARRLGDPIFTKNLPINKKSILDFVENRESFLIDLLIGLDNHSRAALALIFIRGGHLESPIKLTDSEKVALDQLESTLGGSSNALNYLKGSIVELTKANSMSVWQFRHPTIGDAYGKILSSNPELLGIYLEGMAADDLVGQITCGEDEILNLVFIPQSLYGTVIKKLVSNRCMRTEKTEWLPTWRWKSQLFSFLSRRCSRQFLVEYLEENPGLIAEISEPGLYLDGELGIDVVIRLNEVGLFPEEKRKLFINTVSEYAVQGDDLYALENQELRNLFHKDELDSLLVQIHNELIPKLDEVRGFFEDNYQNDRDPENEIQPFLNTLDTLQKEFPSDRAVIEAVKMQEKLVEEWIVENQLEATEIEPRIVPEYESIEHPSKERSIFDDVDE